MHPLFDIDPAERDQLRALSPGGGLAVAAAARDGVLTHPQLVALGLGSSAIGRRIERKLLFPRHRGIYAVGRFDLTPRGRLRAALLHCGRSAVLSHRSAAAQHDLLAPMGRITITVTQNRRRTSRASGIDLHFTRLWLPGDVVWVGGLPCTSVARTLADLAGRPEERAFSKAWNSADGELLLDVGALEEQVVRGRAGAGRVRSRLREYEAVPPTESELEELFYVLVAEHELPRPICQFPLAVGNRAGRVDFVFPAGVAVELDSRRWHAIQAAQDVDREKDMALREAGFDPHRYGWKQVVTQGPRVARLISAAIAARSVRH